MVAVVLILLAALFTVPAYTVLAQLTQGLNPTLPSDVVPPPPPPPPSTYGGNLHGIFMRPIENPAFHTFMGRYPDTYFEDVSYTGAGDNAECSAWNRIAPNYPMVLAVAAYSANPNDVQYQAGFTSASAAAAGTYNAGWNTWINTGISTCGSLAYAVRLNWEWSGNWFGWSPYYTPGTYAAPNVSATTWKNAFCNFYNVWHANAHTANVPVEWDYWGKTAATNQAAYYPGDACVDIIGADLYFLPQYAETWTFYNTSPNSINDWATFAHAHNKPMMVGEWCDAYGSNSSVNDNGQFLTNFANFMATNQFIFNGYWDRDNISTSGPGYTQHCEFALNPTSKQAYITAFQNWPTTNWNFNSSALIPLPASKPAGY